MNLYRIRARFRAHGFSLSCCEHVQANTGADAIKKGLQKIRTLDNLPATEELVFVSAFFLRVLE